MKSMLVRCRPFVISLLLPALLLTGCRTYRSVPREELHFLDGFTEGETRQLRTETGQSILFSSDTPMRLRLEDGSRIVEYWGSIAVDEVMFRGQALEAAQAFKVPLDRIVFVEVGDGWEANGPEEGPPELPNDSLSVGDVVAWILIVGGVVLVGYLFFLAFILV